MVRPRNVGPNEIRGAAIMGGETIACLKGGFHYGAAWYAGLV